MDQEEWRDIPSLPGYQASSLGRIKGPGGKIRSLQTHPRSQYKVFLVSFQAHRLVCEAFHGKPPFPGAMALHGPDPTKANIQPDNLRWGTAQENSDDCTLAGRQNPPKGEEHGRSLLTWDIVNESREAYDNGMGAKDVWRLFGEATGAGYQSFYKMLRRKTWCKPPE